MDWKYEGTSTPQTLRAAIQGWVGDPDGPPASLGALFADLLDRLNPPADQIVKIAVHVRGSADTRRARVELQIEI